MSDNPAEGNQALPTGGTDPSTSSPSGGQGQPLTDVSVLTARLEAAEKQLKGLQKGTDKQIGQLNTQVKRILELKEQGYTESQIGRELFIDELMQNQTVPTPAPVPDKEVAKESGGYSVNDAIAYIEKYNLPPNDPDFINLLRKNPDAGTVKDYVLQKVAPQKQANPADFVQAPARGGATGPDEEKLYGELQVLYKNPSAPGAMARITQIQEQIKKAG